MYTPASSKYRNPTFVKTKKYLVQLVVNQYSVNFFKYPI